MKHERKYFFKAITYFLLLICLISILPIKTFAEKSITVYINEKKISMKTSPVISNGTTFVPLRDISENLGCTVSWDSSTATAKIKDKKSKKTIIIEKNSYTVNGKKNSLNPATINKNGVTLVPLRLVSEALDCTVDWDPYDSSVSIVKYRVVEVSNATELLNNIKNNTKIILTASEYNLTKVKNISNPAIKTEHAFDGEEHIISNVNNIIIDAKDGVVPTLLVTPRYANVLPFENCKNIKIKNIIAGHTIDTGYCTGGVISLANSSNIYIENCKLYGCGTYGIIGENVSDLFAVNSEIYECTYGCVTFNSSRNINLSSCIFRDCKEFSMFEFTNCSDSKVVSSLIKNNETSTYFSFINAENGNNIIFESCEFLNNTYPKLFNGNVKFYNCTIQ